MDKALSLLGIAKRANQISYGEVMMEAIRHKKCQVVLIAADASERSKKQITDKCSFYQIPFFVKYQATEISQAIGKSNIKSVCVNDGNLSKAIIETLTRNEVD